MSTTGNDARQARAPRAALRADIQGLRAFAVVVVLIDHLLRWPGGGFIGVDVFFVISGFLITSHILRELEQKGRLSFADFYRRRARRILPAAVLVLLVTVGASTVLVHRSRALSTAVDGVWALLFSANWRFLSVSTDYFALGQLKSPLQHFWSLSVEEQFYFFWPLLSAAAFAAKPRRPALAFAVFTMVSLGWALVETARAPTTAYFSTWSRAWELGAGALLAALTLRGPGWSLAARVALGWAGLGGLVASLVVISPASAFPAPAALLPVLSTVAVLAAGSGAVTAAYDRALLPLTNRLSGYLGAISYSLYLWHFPVIVLLPSLLEGGTPLFAGVALVVTLVLSVLSYEFVEQPIRESSWLAPRATGRAPRAGFAFAFVALALVTVALVGFRSARRRSLALTNATLEAPCFGAGASAGAGRACELHAPTRGSVVPSLDDLGADAQAFDCWRGSREPLKTCTWGAPDAGARVALVGDSHAAMLLPAVIDQAARFGWQVDSFLGYGCQWRDHPSNADCDAVMEQTQARLLSGHYDMVLTTAARWAVKDATVSSFQEPWAAVRDAGAEVIVIGAVPIVPDATLECIHRLTTSLQDCKTPRSVAFAMPDVLRAAAEESGIAVVDLDAFYCDAEFCPAVIGDVFVYRDSAGHLSATWVRSLAPFLGDRVAARLSAARRLP